jgi:ABC-2 type transport system permease protein
VIAEGGVPPASMGRLSLPPRESAAPSRAIWFWRVLVAFTRREIATAAGYRISFLVRMFSALVSVLALAFFSRMVGASVNPHLAEYGGDYLAFVVVGLVIMDFQQIGVTSLSQRIRNAQLLGLFEAELATPVPPWIVLGVGPVYEFVAAIVRAVAYFLLAVLVFGVRFPRASLTTLLVAAPLVLGAFVGIGLVSAATQMLVRRNNPVAVFLASTSFLLSGVAYPVTVLPPALRTAGRLLPMTHALEVVRGALLRGASVSELAGSIVALALFCGLLIPLGATLFVLALRRARIDGSLSHY